MNELIKSKRFWLAIGTAISVAAKDYLPLTEDQIQQLVMVIGAWIIGDSLRQTSPPGSTQRKFYG